MAGELVPSGVDGVDSIPDFSRLQGLRSAMLSLVDPGFEPLTTVEESYAARLETDLDATAAQLRRTTNLPSVQWTYLGCVAGSLARPERFSPATRAIAADWYQKKTA